MRQTFDIPPIKKGHAYRLILGGAGCDRSGEGFAIYVNGKLLTQSNGGFFRYSGIRGAYIYNDILPEFESGKVTMTKYEDGKSFDWSEVTGKVLSIKSKSGLPPSDAYVKIYYRDHWFYIEDSDLNSKSTFNLLMQLYNLQSGDNQGDAPVLTLPLGG